MTVCPIALAVGCQKCVLFAICPATRLLGDQPSAPASPTKAAPAKKPAKAGKPAKKR